MRGCEVLLGQALGRARSSGRASPGRRRGRPRWATTRVVDAERPRQQVGVGAASGPSEYAGRHGDGVRERGRRPGRRRRCASPATSRCRPSRPMTTSVKPVLGDVVAGAEHQGGVDLGDVVERHVRRHRRRSRRPPTATSTLDRRAAAAPPTGRPGIEQARAERRPHVEVEHGERLDELRQVGDLVARRRRPRTTRRRRPSSSCPPTWFT